MPQNPRILVVDDNQAVLVMYNSLLSHQGYDVFTASNGNDCIRIAKKERPDLILLDVMMPRMDGGMTASLLAQDPQTQGIQIVFLTSIVSEEEALSQSNVPGGRQFMSKSSPPNVILAKVRHLLGL